MSIPEDTRARYTGMCSLGDDGPSTVLGFSFNDVLFSVVAASPDDDEGAALLPLSYEFDESLEGKILNEIDDLSYHDGPTWPKANEEATSRLQKQLADLAADACLSTMQHLAPARIPTAQTLQDHLYSPTFTLQVLTEGGKLTCRTLDNFTGVPELHPPISSDRLQAMNLDLDTTDVPVVEASQVILGCRLHCAPIWKVTVGGKEMICKASLDVSEHAMGDELATYLKIRAAGVKLNVPELKGTQMKIVIRDEHQTNSHTDRNCSVASMSGWHSPLLHFPQTPQPPRPLVWCRGRHRRGE